MAFLTRVYRGCYLILSNRKVYRVSNTSERLRKWEMLFGTQANWHKCFHSFFEFSHSCYCCNRNTQNMFSITFRKSGDKEENNLFTVIIRMSILFAHAFIMSTLTACASSVFISRCGKMILNQSACILSLGYFLINK